MNASPLNLSFSEIYLRLSEVEGPLCVFFSDGSGFEPILAATPFASLTSSSNQEVLNFEWQHKNHLITAAFPFEFGSPSQPAQLHAFKSWIRFKDQKAYIEGDDLKAKAELLRLLESSKSPLGLAPLGLSTDQLSRSIFTEAVKQISQWICAGEIYQLNYTTALTSPTDANPRDWFLLSTCEDPPAFSALFEAPDLCLLSLSPERFIQTQGEKIYADPIKGTRARLPQDIGDQNQIKSLQESEKEAAELNMITDLLRNDLGRISKIGSITVEKNRSISLHRNIIHTHSRITGRLKPPYFALSALLELLPGGSISGCPKPRAIQLIKELEETPRGFYTGTLGYRLPCGDLCFNILIRTLIFQNGQVHLGVGGGITLDSDPDAEFEEAKQKAQSVLSRFI